VKEAHINANTKSGVIGVLVRIAPPGTVFPGKKAAPITLPKVIESATEITQAEEEGAENEKEDSEKEKKYVPRRPAGKR
jgi:ribosomal protein S3